MCNSQKQGCFKRCVPERACFRCSCWAAVLAQEEAGRGRGRGRQPPQPVEEEDDGDIDDEDLIASTSGMDSPTGASSQQTGAASNR